MIRLLFLLCAAAIIVSCSPTSRLGLEKSLRDTESKFQDHVGFMLYDLDAKKSVYEYNAHKYFTPASNTKIFTLYTALRTIGDSIPSFSYIERNDSLVIWGSGDPSFLYKNTFTNSRVYDFLSKRGKKLYLSTSHFYSEPLGPGWAWDDYNSYYSAERSSFPVYGNIFTVERKGALLTVKPEYFERFLTVGKRKKEEDVIRDVESNDFAFHPGLGNVKTSNDWDIPIRTDPYMMASILGDTLDRKVSITAMPLPPLAVPFYSIPSDSLYRIMMQDSDNFIAEQLLLICAGIVRDSLKTEIAIDYSIRNYLNDLPDKPVWVDGSGLSRYNLFTPRSIVRLWEKIYELVPRERLFTLLAIGGKKGTIKNWYKGEQPFVFGKTGSLSNNHALSGFLVTRSGKTLIFAFMNNNFVTSTSPVRTEMQQILKTIHEKY